MEAPTRVPGRPVRSLRESYERHVGRSRVGFGAQLETIRAIGEEVIPYFRDSSMGMSDAMVGAGTPG